MTLREVARESGLSVTQTSRALNGHGDVAAASRQRAERAARRLGYVPNFEARKLRKPDARSYSIGLVLATGSQRFSDPFFGELLTSLVDVAATHGYELQLSAPLADEDPTASYDRALRANRVDGFIVLRAALDDTRIRYLVEHGQPFVTFGRVPGIDGHPAVDESIECLRPAVDHLVGLGHRRIGCLAEPLDFAIAARRHDAFHAALAAHGLRADPRHVVVRGYREDAGFDAAGRLLDSADPPTALVAFNDLLAIGALRAASERNIAVPDQLSVVGFDDVQPSRFSSPPLTTLRHPTPLIAHHLITGLLATIDEPTSAPTVELIPELVVRASTGPS